MWKSKRIDISFADCYALVTQQEMAQVLVTTDPVPAKIKGIRIVHIELD